MRELRKDDTVCILQSDKGNATFILDTEDYDTKVQDLLNDRQSYIILKKDPTKTVERNVLRIIRDLRKEKKISEAFYNSVRPSEGSSKPARFFGRIKLHKPSAPLRPIVSTCGTATYELARSL